MDFNPFTRSRAGTMRVSTRSPAFTTRSLLVGYCFGVASTGLGVLVWLWSVSVPHVCP